MENKAVTARRWLVDAVIELKESLHDPEGDTIIRDLIRKKGWYVVDELRTAKLLRFKVRADSGEEAEEIVSRICSELRLYNPVSHICRVKCGGPA